MNLWPLPPSTLVGRGSPNILSPGLGKHGEKTQHILCLSVHVSNLQLISQQAPSTHIRILITLTSLSLSLSLSLSWWVSNTEIKGIISAWSSCNGWKRINYQTTNQLQLSFMKNFTCTNKRKYKCWQAQLQK